MKIYISHAENDTHLAQQISRELRIAGFETAGLVSELFPGENWATALGSALQSADWCVILLKAGCLTISDRMRAEVQFVLGDERYRDRVIPVFAQYLIGPTDVPWVLTNLPTFRQVVSGDPREVAAEVIGIVKGAAVAG